MKYSIILLLTCYSATVSAQHHPRTEHVFIITTDGFRWQEVFSGADSLMINTDELVKDKALIRQQYWDSTAELRRKKLMPFFWNVIARDGQLYGNRSLNNKVDMRNLYWISYPGYNEILTGYPDPIPNPNLSLNNRNVNVLEFLNNLPRYNGKVAAFGTWKVFPYIINEKRNHIPVYSGYKDDLLTFAAAKEYIGKNHPSVVFIGFGETDESAHAARYDLYLQNAVAVDRMIAELWYMVQTDPEYKDHTTFIITTDHGRGAYADSWHTHNLFTKGSGETWLACIGAGIQPLGEMKGDGQIYGKQLAATICRLLGEDFETDHRVGAAIPLPPISIR